MKPCAAVILALLAVATAGHGQTWEKPIAPGLIYREEVDRSIPRVIHALRLSLKSPFVHAVPALAGKLVNDTATSTGRGAVSAMVRDEVAIAGINGDFFAMQNGPTGNPLGMMVRQGQLVAPPSRRIAFAWGPQDIAVGVASFRGSIKTDAGAVLPLDGLNQKCPRNGIVINTPAAGRTIVDGPATVAVIRTERATWAPSTVVTGTVESIGTSVDPEPIGTDRATIVGQGLKAAALTSLRVGDKISVSLETTGFDWERIENAIGGGPTLVRDGKIAVDSEAQGFPTSFSAKRHPRTAIGRTKDGGVWLVAVDGRQTISDGATLDELAQIMLRYGCTDAINLDGGGSTTINVLGSTLNRPSDGQERAVADGIVLVGPLPKPMPGPLRILAPTRVPLGATVDLHVIQGRAALVPNAQVLWSATGSAWIDQGGRLWMLGTGPATITATAFGRSLTAKVQVVGAGSRYVPTVLPQDHDPDNDPRPAPAPKQAKKPKPS